MEANKVHYRHLMLFFYRKGKYATQATNKICAVYGEGAVADRTVRKWSARFKAGDFSLEDQERLGRPSTRDEDQIKTMIENNPHHTTCKVGEMLNISKSTIHEHFVKLGYINRFDVWVPHDLTEKNLMDRISICDSVYKRNEETPFLKQLVTGDEKSTPKADLHPKKVMLCVCWNWKRILYYDLLANNETINSEKYCSQLEDLRVAIEQKRPEMANRKGVMFHQDNARPHVSLTTRQKLLELGWDVVPHPPYSPDLAPSDFHLFRYNSKLDMFLYNNERKLKLNKMFVDLIVFDLQPFVIVEDKGFRALLKYLDPRHAVPCRRTLETLVEDA
ncbi:PREDICTED: histone-lysine N-methyltransferase SETMAR-like [Habropoda laboriosa]|uniref:histone-lysine N-methyltransferase SETMAR-like n=1 Tax=Habropoda laboriosa TaxID=597456 RepID=UPI00083D8CE3|nr:PREDICTED: histone-lysine N-methyltransferase SETMAR-like [Habropoda laboriosa]